MNTLQVAIVGVQILNQAKFQRKLSDVETLVEASLVEIEHCENEMLSVPEKLARIEFEIEEVKELLRKNEEQLQNVDCDLLSIQQLQPDVQHPVLQNSPSVGAEAYT